MEVGLTHYIFVGALIFYLSLLGMMLHRKSIIHLLICLELMLLAVNINFIAFSWYLNDLLGQIFTLFILTVAAAEAAIGLAIVVIYFRQKGSIETDELDELVDETEKVSADVS